MSEEVKEETTQETAPTEEPKVEAPAAEPEPPKEDPKVEEPPKEEPKADVEPERVVPEKYEFKKAEDSLLNDVAMERIEKYARDNELTQEEANTLLAQQEQLVKENTENQVKAWESEIKDDKEFGGQKLEETTQAKTKAMERFTNEEERAELAKLGYDKYPILTKIMARVGQAMANDKFVGGVKDAAPQKSLAQRLFPNSGQGASA